MFNFYWPLVQLHRPTDLQTSQQVKLIYIVPRVATEPRSINQSQAVQKHTRISVCASGD